MWFNTVKRKGKPVWDNTKRVNHQNFSKYPHLSKTFVPSGVLTRTGLHRPNVSTARPVCTARPSVSTARPVCTARPSVSTTSPVCTARPSLSTARPVCTTRPIYPKMDNVRPRGSCSPIKRSYYTKPVFRPKDLKQDVKTFGVQNMTTVRTRAVVNTVCNAWIPKKRQIPPTFVSGQIPEILLQDHAVVDSGCFSHMTGNKAYLSDYEDFNGGFVAFGSDPKGERINKKRCDNGTEFKNHVMNEFGARMNQRSFSVARNSPAEKGNSDEGYFPGYSTSSKAFRVYNKRTKRVEENLHINFLKDQPNVAGTGPNWINVIERKGQHQMPEDEHSCMMNLKDGFTQELTTKAMDEVSDKPLEEKSK
ncbi:hypothetical protein Tco_1028660 [Tanacetum coccineum]|uniref:Retroviral polymerase SH3-like domain-containing protein n=1 Tax=Tanacetum coccineum TaxID=301880 RepID=A0ABQ5G1N8_9ASTR